MSDSDEAAGADLRFGEAMEELEGLLRKIESDQVDIDELAEQLGRAARLLELCRAKIRRAEAEIAQVVHQLDDPPPETE